MVEGFGIHSNLTQKLLPIFSMQESLLYTDGKPIAWGTAALGAFYYICKTNF